MYLGNQDGVYRWREDAARWEPSSQGLPPGGVLALAVSPADPRVIYAGLPGGLSRSLDGGQSWTATTWNKRGVPALLLDSDDPNHLFIRAMYERVYESRDGGTTWTARWDGLGLPTQVIALAGDATDTRVLYAGAGQGLFRSADGGGTWQAAGAELAGQTVFCVLVSPTDRETVHAGATDGVWRSRDGGAHWEIWGRGLQDVTVTTLAFDPRNARHVLAGTKYRGVFESENGGETWTAAGPDEVSVNGMLFVPGSGELFVATEHGVFVQEVAP
jgi:photosystem II stability/assembly factor-like uncharacterized protein